VDGQTDASVGTAKQGKSIAGGFVTCAEGAGATTAYAQRTEWVDTSSYAAELDGATKIENAMTRTTRTLEQLLVEVDGIASMKTDNAAACEFIEGRGVAPNAKHMQLRAWKLREKYITSGYEIFLVPGNVLCADMLTKANTEADHIMRTCEIMGLHLLGIKDLKGMQDFLSPRNQK
jgi:hypothetical protein